MDEDETETISPLAVMWRDRKEFGISLVFYPFNWKLDAWHERGNSFVRIGPFGFFTHSPW